MVSSSLKLPALTQSCPWPAISFIEGRTLFQESLLAVAIQGQTVQSWNLTLNLIYKNQVGMFPDCPLRHLFPMLHPRWSLPESPWRGWLLHRTSQVSCPGVGQESRASHVSTPAAQRPKPPSSSCSLGEKKN